MHKQSFLGCLSDRQYPLVEGQVQTLPSLFLCLPTLQAQPEFLMALYVLNS